MSYTIVLFVHNTVSQYKKVSYENSVDTFVNLSFNHVKNRADLDCRPAFISYSDDATMVQLIGDMTFDLQRKVINAISVMRNMNEQ